MRLATFNILHGLSPEDGRVDVDRFADAVRLLDADVLALQEVDRNQGRSAHADLTAVAAEAMGAPSTVSSQPSPARRAPRGGRRRAPSPPTRRATASRCSRATRSSPGRAIRLPPVPVAVPMTFAGRRRPVLVRDEPRVAVTAVMDTPRGQVTVAAVHLTFIPGWNAHQLRRLTSALRTRTPARWC